MEHDGPGAQAAGLEAMQRTAAKRGRDYDKNAAGAGAAPGSAAFQDYSRRSFFKEFVKVGAAPGGGPGCGLDFPGGACSLRAKQVEGHWFPLPAQAVAKGQPVQCLYAPSRVAGVAANMAACTPHPPTAPPPGGGGI